MNKPVYLSLLMLSISKIVSSGMIAQSRNMEKRQSSSTWIQRALKTEDVYVDIAKDVEARFGTSNFELKRPLLSEKKKTYSVNGELDGKIMIESVALRLKTNSYLIGNGDTNRKANITKKYVIK